MRRRPKVVVTDEGATYPAYVFEFIPHDWPGAIDWDRYEAWQAAREVWAVANLPDGVAGLPFRLDGYIPDAPFDPYSA